MADSKNFTTTILVDQNPPKAFNAIKKFRAWWSEEIEGNTDQISEPFVYHYKDIHFYKIKLIEAIADKKLVYQLLDNHFNFIEDTCEWVNTKLIFDITQQDGKTSVKFTHGGLVSRYECYAICDEAWTGYIQKSLYHFIMTDKGEPNPKDNGL